MEKNNQLYRRIPKVDRILEKDFVKEAINEYGKKPVLDEIHRCLQETREKIQECCSAQEVGQLTDAIPILLQTRFRNLRKKHFQHVINATGVVLHTNLGRAPMGEEAVKEALDLMIGYTNLEYDLQKGTRGTRYSHFEELICSVTGAEAAMAVNNNAAAVLLMVSAVAAGKEVVVSRGEQIEIGGKFRIPDIVQQSGAVLREVGTTNKTRIEDYENASGPETGAFLKVHTSNFIMEGFTESVSREELSALGHRNKIPVLEDLGSGVLVDLGKFGLKKEPTVQESICAGVDLVSFSGDKLLGGPQAGILAGKKELIDLCRRHPLTRAFRIDKFTAAMLEKTFDMYRDPGYAEKHIPVLQMLSESEEELMQKAVKLKEILDGSGLPLETATEPCTGVPGGGSLPGQQLASICVRIRKNGMNAQYISEKLRKCDPAVILLVREGQLVLDMRTVFAKEIPVTGQALLSVLK